MIVKNCQNLSGLNLVARYGVDERQIRCSLTQQLNKRDVFCCKLI